MQYAYRAFSRVWMLASILLASLLWFGANAQQADAYSYVSKTISDVSVSSSSTAVDATNNVTMTFTWPTDSTNDLSWSTSDYIYVYAPYFYNYNGGTYNWDTQELSTTSSDITSNKLTYVGGSSTYAYFQPTAALQEGDAVTITFNNTTNPSMEGIGSWSVSAYDWGNDISTSIYGSGSSSIGVTDVTATVKDSDGSTPVSGVNIYLSYYNTSNWSDYQYLSGYTDSSGQLRIPGLVDGRTYSVSFYYSGTTATGDTPGSTTLTYNGTDSAPTYTFVGKNVTTHFKDKNGTAVNNAYWYMYKTDYTNYSTDYVWRWGYTDATGTISAAASVDGNYSLYVQDTSNSNYNYFSYDFTVTGGVESGLADPIQPPTAEVSGTVRAGSSGASGVSVYIHNSNWTTYQYDTTDSNGAFEFALGKNCASCKVEISSWGLPTGYFAPAATAVAVTANTPGDALTLDLQSASKTITGTITKNADSIAKITAGTPVTDASVSCWQSGGSYNYVYGNTDSNGAFTFQVTGGKWQCSVYQSTWPSTWAYTGDTISVSFANDSTSESSSLNLQVDPYNSSISGTITYPDGTPVAENAVYVYSSGGTNGSVYSYDYTDANGAFTLNTTQGSHNLYLYFYGSSGTANYVAPTIETVVLKAGEAKALGTLALVEKNSRIKGTATIRSTSEGVNNLSVYAYKQGGSWDWASATTDSNGEFELKVSPGEWSVYIYTWGLTTESGAKLLYTGGALTVSIDENETVSGQDFGFDIADATISFNVQNSSGTELTEEYGWASVSESDDQGDYGWYSTGCYISRGNCTVDVASDVEYDANYYSYNNWGWAEDDEDTYTYSYFEVDDVQASSVTVDPNTTEDVNLVMAQNDVTANINFVDENGAAEIYGYIYASNGNGAWAYKNVNGESTVTMKLSAGTWNLNYWTYGSWISYEDKAEEKKITVESGETKEVTFAVLESDATVSGTVLNPSGTAVDSPTFVKVSTSYGTNETATEEKYGLIEQTTYTDDNGVFSLNVPSGTYYLSASSAEYLDPQPIQITADTNGGAENLEIQFVSSDATLGGTVSDSVGIGINNIRSLAVGDPVASAMVYAFSSKGGSQSDETDENGTYELSVVGGETWYVMSVFESEGQAHYSTLETVKVVAGANTQNMTLSATLTLPEPQTLKFDPQNGVVLKLENGVEVNIPANSITSEDIAEVTVVITPTYQLAQKAGSRPLSIGYEITATNAAGDPITQLDDNVTITIPYTDADLDAAGITEDDLKVGYFNSESDDWENQGGAVLDTDNNQYVISTDHFSQFAIISGRSVSDDGEDVNTNVLKAPKGLKASKRYAKQMTLQWKNATGASTYEVQVSNAKGGKVIKTLSAQNRQKTVKKMVANKAYKVRVRSVSDTGTKSGWSKAVQVRTKPAAPASLSTSGLSITGSNGAAVTLQWKKSRGTVKKYIVQIAAEDNTVVKTVNTKKRTVTVTDLDRGTNYTFRIKARFNKKNVSVFSTRKAFSTPSGL